MSEIKTLLKNSKRGGARANAGRPSKKDLIQLAAYEAGERWNPARAMVFMPTLEPRKELGAGTRLEITRKAWWFIHNFGAAARCIEGVARYVGPLVPQARGGDSAWCRDVDERFENDNCTEAFAFDVGAEVNFYEAQPFIVKHMAAGGDFFWQKMLSATGRAMARFIPSESIGNANTQLDQSKWFDGALVDAFGRVSKWRVLKDADGKSWTDVSSDDLHQIRRPYRKGYVRSPSWLARAANHLQDISEILSFEKQSTKLNAQVAYVLTSQDPSTGMSARRTASSPDTVNVDSLFNSSAVARLKTNEKLESFRSEHPNENFEAFLNYLMRDISWGIGISPELLWSIAGIGGANTRFVLEDAAIFFRELQSLLENKFCRPFYKFWLWSEIQAGRIKYPGEGWWKCDWIPPQKITVDIGRDGRLMSELLSRGQMSPQRYYNLQGLFADKEDDDTIRFHARRKKRVEEISAEEGVDMTVAEVFPPAPGSPVPVVAELPSAPAASAA